MVTRCSQLLKSFFLGNRRGALHRKHLYLVTALLKIPVLKHSVVHQGSTQKPSQDRQEIVEVCRSTPIFSHFSHGEIRQQQWYGQCHGAFFANVTDFVIFCLHMQQNCCTSCPQSQGCSNKRCCSASLAESSSQWHGKVQMHGSCWEPPRLEQPVRYHLLLNSSLSPG